MKEFFALGLLLLGLHPALACVSVPGMTTEYNVRTLERGCRDLADPAPFEACVQDMLDFGVEVNGLTAGQWIYTCFAVTKQRLSAPFRGCVAGLLGSSLPPSSVNAITWFGNCEFASVNGNQLRYQACMEHFTRAAIDHNGTNAFKWINGCRVAAHNRTESGFMSCLDRSLSSIAEPESDAFYQAILRCTDEASRGRSGWKEASFPSDGTELFSKD